MTLTKTIVGILVLMALVMGLGYLALQYIPNLALGGVTIGSEYHASSTKNHLGNTIPDLNVLVACQGVLGSVIITGTNTGSFALYDATSTVTNAEWATTTLVQFPANSATGTYIFDLNFRKGLLLDYVTNMATGTITYRTSC